MTLYGEAFGEIKCIDGDEDRKPAKERHKMERNSNEDNGRRYSMDMHI